MAEWRAGSATEVGTRGAVASEAEAAPATAAATAAEADMTADLDNLARVVAE